MNLLLFINELCIVYLRNSKGLLSDEELNGILHLIGEGTGNYYPARRKTGWSLLHWQLRSETEKSSAGIDSTLLHYELAPLSLTVLIDETEVSKVHWKTGLNPQQQIQKPAERHYPAAPCRAGRQPVQQQAG
ncbi:hypothetical protein [Larkinella harenae]